MERKYLFLIVGISTAIIVVALLFVAFFLTPQRILKENLYTKEFGDLSGLLRLDVIIHYETESDGTWRRTSQARYNITVFVKLTYVNESVMSKLKVIYWGVGGIPTSIWGGWVEDIPQSAPIDYGSDLMGFWFNQSAWRVGSDIYQPSLYSLPLKIKTTSLTPLLFAKF